MSDLKLKLNAEDIVDNLREQTGKVIEDIEKDLRKSAALLGKSGKQHAEKLASEKLPSALEDIYIQNLYMEQVSDNIVEIGIREDALWIEEGRKGGFMDELLENDKSGTPAKVSKDGKKYRVIPMKKSTTSSKNSSSQSEEAVSELKNFLRKNNIRYSKTRALALDENGSPRIGKVQSLDIKKMRDKNKKGSDSLSRNLQGVSVYQNFNPKTQRVERNVMAFRVISEKSKDMGKWTHPGRAPERILDQTLKWIEDTWEKQILPELKGKYESR